MEGDNAIDTSAAPESSEETHSKKPKVKGGYTCCVPGCYSNNKRDKTLSFHKIPQDEPYRSKWINNIKRKDFIPGEHHRVCSLHFRNGKKMGTTDIPVLFPLLPKPSFRKPPTTRPAPVKKPRQKFISSSSISSTAAESDITEICSLGSQTSESLVDKLQQEIAELKIKVEALSAEKFCLQRFAGNDDDIRFYTGFPSYATFCSFYEFLGPAVTQLNYWGSDYQSDRPPGADKRGPSRKVQPIDELFIVLYRLRCNPLEKDIGDRFNLHPSTISRIVITWINFLYFKLKQLPIWASQQTVNDTMPACFKAHYPQTRVIIDCTEIFIQMPSSFRAQSQTYSQYKSHNTAKGLVGISPSGMVTFVSHLYGGHVSDKAITQSCGIIELLEEGDVVMADRGFDIQDLLVEKRAILNIPPFLRDRDQLTVEEEAETRQIASVRIHVERAIERIKNFRILQGVIPLSLHEQLDHIWFICCILTNFLPQLVE